MDIKKQWQIMIIACILLSLAITIYPLGKEMMIPGTPVETLQITPEVKTSDVTLIDKVYTFTITSPSKVLEEIPFQATYKYYIYFQVVTPHECEITVTIFDPEGSQFDVYHEENFTQEDGLANFPFGAALTGPHDIQFDVNLSFNLNMYIKIEETIQCLYDVFSWQESQKVRQYGVIKFEDSPPLIRNLVLESDVAYTLYLSRVTPLSDLLPDYIVHYEYTLLDDDQDTIFIINWKDTPLAPINDVTAYSFGTAHGGPYQTNLTVEYDYNPVNIAYAIIYDYKISGDIDENDTLPDGSQDSLLSFKIPVEMATGTFIVIGALLLVATGMTIIKRRKFNSY